MHDSYDRKSRYISTPNGGYRIIEHSENNIVTVVYYDENGNSFCEVFKKRNRLGYFFVSILKRLIRWIEDTWSRF